MEIKLDQTDVTPADINSIHGIDVVSTASREVPLFEVDLVYRVGGENAVAVKSGTSALFHALKAHNIGPGDEVFIPEITYIATANAVMQTGANPVLVEVNEHDWCMDLRHERIIDRILNWPGSYTGKRVVMPVDLYGVIPHYTSDMYSWLSDRGIPIVFDSSQSFGQKILDNHLHCYSFNGNKMITTGGGGAIIGSTPLIVKIEKILHAPTFDGVAYNDRMPGFNAALGRSQLHRLHSTLLVKANITKQYHSNFKNYEDKITLQRSVRSSSWYFPMLFDSSETLRSVTLALAVDGIPYRRIFKPLRSYAHIAAHKSITLNRGVSNSIYERGLCLPVSTTMSISQQERVIEIILKAIGA